MARGDENRMGERMVVGCVGGCNVSTDVFWFGISIVYPYFDQFLSLSCPPLRIASLPPPAATHSLSLIPTHPLPSQTNTPQKHKNLIIHQD